MSYKTILAVAGIAAMFAVGVFAQTKSAPSVGTFKDSRDRKTYKTVKVGSQTWFAENLNFAVENSKCLGEGGIVIVDEGDVVEMVGGITAELSNAEVQANCTKYGRLYDGETANKACPAGFHLPSDDEWTTLVDYAGGEKKAGKKLKSKAGWNDNGNGTDDYGWSALPGSRGEGSIFYPAGDGGHWWSATEHSADYAWYRSMGRHDGSVGRSYIHVYTYLFSVRCIQDK